MVTQEFLLEARASPKKRARTSLQNLLGIAGEAVKIRPPLWISSIFGLPWSWIPPHERYSEFRIIDPWRMRRTLKFLTNVTIPSLPRTPPPFGPPLLDDLFWEPTVILQRPDHNGSYTSFPQEAWYFINGIMTNDAIAQVNAAYIAYLFHRPITLIQNSTNSFWIDMLQCALGKEWDHTVEPAIKAFDTIYDALKSEKQRVVVIAHSQGTLIAARLLEMLNSITLAPEEGVREAEAVPRMAAGFPAPPEFIYPDQSPIQLSDFEPLEAAELAKLEIYCFANCATRMRYFRPAGETGSPIPWIEHFGNEFDIVARLGMLAPHPAKWEIQIDGPRYVRPGAWGHLLNEHYLTPIEEYQRAGRRKGGAGGTAPFVVADASEFVENIVPRLYQYINGGR